jgi:hypothetical protein
MSFMSMDHLGLIPADQVFAAAQQAFQRSAVFLAEHAHRAARRTGRV